MRKQRGFTLIELLVVIAIIAILAAILFPVFARASFGIQGAHIPSFLRAIVACGWFGIQTWIGGQAIYTMLKVAIPEWEPPLALPLSFLGFWLANMYVVVRGSNAIKWLETSAAPFLILCGLALLAWAYQGADGFGPMLKAGSTFENPSDFWALFWPSLTAMVGFWATLSLNIPDFSRFARSQRSQIIGQIIGLPVTMFLFSGLGVLLTAAGLAGLRPLSPRPGP